MVETRSSQMGRIREKEHAEPSNVQRGRHPRNPHIGPQNRPNPKEDTRDQDRISMTRAKLVDLVETAIRRAMEKRPMQEPSRNISHPDLGQGRPQERVPREEQGERRIERSRVDEGEI